MRKILDALFRHRKPALVIPVLAAAVVYLLFLLFGNAADDLRTLIMTPTLSALWFFGVFFIVYIQVKNASCPEWFLNLLELLVTVLPGLYAVIGTIFFVAGGFQNFEFGLCLGYVTYSAVAWAHSKRSTE